MTTRRLSSWITTACCALRLLAPAWALRSTPGEDEADRRGGAGRAARRPPLAQALHGRPEESRERQWWTRSNELDERREESIKTYAAVVKTLAHPNLEHSQHILQFVSSLKYAPSLHSEGCLYLPNNVAWQNFYTFVEHPYPPMFSELIANAFYPGCGNTSLSGVTMEFCGRGKVKGIHGCFRHRQMGSVNGIHLFETDGHVGLPGKWARHAQRAAATSSPSHNWAGSKMRLADKCNNNMLLAAVPKNHRLKIPTKFVVCSVTANETRVSRSMIESQVEWMNADYSGKSKWTKVMADTGPPQHADMQIQFELKDVQFVHDSDCAEFGFSDIKHSSKYHTNPTREFTFVVIADDASGILGMAPFPMDTQEDDSALLVLISTFGLRQFSSVNKDMLLDLSYDEGDTAAHEAGHSLGLFHTFENGCMMGGDQVSDTFPEAMPSFTCVNKNSCMSQDPIHNFMDYTPDSCMSGFTELQKRRVWCVFQNYRKTLYHESLIKPR